jgi:hypothetical protein
MLPPVSDHVDSLRAEVRCLTDDGRWNEADAPTQRLVELEPDSYWANAQRCQVVLELRGAALALSFAERALDLGFCCASCSAHVERVLWAAGDPERALTASAVTRILARVDGSLPTRRRMSLEDAVDYVLRSIESSADSIAHAPPMRALRVVALIRGGHLFAARSELAQLPSDAFAGTMSFDGPTMAGQLAFRLGLMKEAEQLLVARLSEKRLVMTGVNLVLLRAHTSGLWPEYAQELEAMAVEGNDALMRHAAAIAHEIAGAHEAATAVLDPALTGPASYSLELVARALALRGDDPGPAARYLLMATTWDGSGDCLNPIGRVAIDRVLSQRPRTGSGLTTMQAILCLDRLGRKATSAPA